MRALVFISITFGVIALVSGCNSQVQSGGEQIEWIYNVHDGTRPTPEIIVPGDSYGQPPSDAIVLFDGKDLSHWDAKKGGPAKWKVENGYMEINGTGDIQTKEAFGDCQLHIEWASPAQVKGLGQDRGNSGVYLMGLYEIQILDNYENWTYADGQTGGVYGQQPPLVNASRKPGEWQSYDIIFRGPRFDEQGKLLRPARVTVLWNGVVVQECTELYGATVWRARAKYSPHAERLPLQLQDHKNPVRFRNIWIRELKDPLADKK